MTTDANGIIWGSNTSWALGAVTKERYTPPPTAIVRQERVPGSNLIWDFSTLLGAQEYDTRQLRYVFTISNSDHNACRAAVNAFISWLYSVRGYGNMYDSADSGFHYSARLKAATPKYTNGVYCEITVEFEAKPEVISNV